jgi:acyl-homoserine lactone acylase PvdQ
MEGISYSETIPLQNRSPPTFSEVDALMTVSEMGVDLTDDIIDEAVDQTVEDGVENPSSSTNIPNPHYYVGYIPDNIPERIRPFVVDTTVGIDVAGNNLPDSFNITSSGPSSGNQTGAGVLVDQDNSDTDTASGVDSDE